MRNQSEKTQMQQYMENTNSTRQSRNSVSLYAEVKTLNENMIKLTKEIQNLCKLLNKR